MARLEEAAAEEEAPQGRGRGRGHGARSCVEELWELEVGIGVPEHCHRRPRALRLKLNMEEPSKTKLSRTSPYHPT
jgi:hypothetical protein